jgi:hypothetical protein
MTVKIAGGSHVSAAAAEQQASSVARFYSTAALYLPFGHYSFFFS